MRPAVSWMFLLAAVACGGDDDDGAPPDAGGDGDADGDAGASDDAGTDGGDPGDPCLGRPGDDLVTIAAILEGLPGAIALATDGTTAVVCGAGFVQTVDLSTDAAGQALVLDGPCRGAAVDGARAAVTTASGDLFLYAIGGGAELAEESRASTGGTLGGALFVEDVLLVAAGAQGVLRFDVASGALTPLVAYAAASDARAVVDAGDGRIAVADGTAGAALLDAETGEEVARLEPPIYEQILVDPDAEGGVRDVAQPFEVSSIAASADWLFVGCGGYGHVRATRDGDVLGEALRSPTPFGRPPGVEGVVRGVAIANDELLFADGGSLVRLGVAADGALSWIARERRPGRGTIGGSFWQAVEFVGETVLALTNDALYRVGLAAPAPAPTLDLGRESVFVQATPGGDPATALLQIGNFGDAELAVRLVGVDPEGQVTGSFLSLPGAPGPDAEDATCLRVPPGPNVGAVEVVFTPTTEAPVEGLIRLETNDPDAPMVEVPIRANPHVLAPGDDAPDFTLVGLDGLPSRLSDLAGEVVLLKFFNFQ